PYRRGDRAAANCSEHGLHPLAHRELIRQWPQVDRARAGPTPEGEAFDLLRIGGQPDAMNASRRVALNAAQEREQARVPCAIGAKWTARMEAQHRIDVVGEHRKVELADVGEIARG